MCTQDEWRFLPVIPEGVNFQKKGLSSNAIFPGTFFKTSYTCLMRFWHYYQSTQPDIKGIPTNGIIDSLAPYKHLKVVEKKISKIKDPGFDMERFQISPITRLNSVFLRATCVFVENKRKLHFFLNRNKIMMLNWNRQSKFQNNKISFIFLKKTLPWDPYMCLGFIIWTCEKSAK